MSELQMQKGRIQAFPPATSFEPTVGKFRISVGTLVASDVPVGTHSTVIGNDPYLKKVLEIKVN
ncbi:MAG: hypothetical protein JNM78_17130 [Cyclobacteriaceae bacterium]|nr:hypothetical protein [Cyclobacteriaceae bacterium]